MHQLLHSRTTYVLLALLTIAIVIFMGILTRSGGNEPIVTATLERGTVEQLVSVSGVIQAEQTANLAFPTSGIVTEVPVNEGDEVMKGDTLITLDTSALQADRRDGEASVARAIATRDELLAGADINVQKTNSQTVALKETTLATTRAAQVDLVQNARRLLLSSDLTTISNDGDESAKNPLVSGTYQCDSEGTYVIDVYSSNSESGYSFRLSGLESGTFAASIDQPSPIGTCGLRLQFDEDSLYDNTRWIIEIPNIFSSQYIQNRNAYTLAKTQAESAVAVAEQDLALAQATAESLNAPARSEAIARANADIVSAQSRIDRIDSQLADRVIRAPFDGIITNVDILPGEAVTTAPVVTLLAAADFELTARIPEIDIGKLQVNQSVRARFDARDSEIIAGSIDFISLQATEIDGVAYYEAVITLNENPPWLRSGLNADIDIIITQATDVVRVPRRFVTVIDDVASVQLVQGTQVATTTIDVLLNGDDGFVAVSDNSLNVGATVAAPE